MSSQCLRTIPSKLQDTHVKQVHTKTLEHMKAFQWKLLI